MIRRSTAALVHPCVQTYIRRSGAPPLSSHRPLSRPSRSTFVLRVGIRYIVVNKVTMFSLRYMMNDYKVHMVHRITTSRTNTALAHLTSSSSAHRPPRQHVYIRHLHSYACIYTSRSTAALVRPCVSMYTAEHRRPRSPMCTNIYTAEWSTATLVTPPSLAA